MTDLPQLVRLHRLHQRRKHVLSVTRGLLQVGKALARAERDFCRADVRVGEVVA